MERVRTSSSYAIRAIASQQRRDHLQAESVSFASCNLTSRSSDWSAIIHLHRLSTERVCIDSILCCFHISVLVGLAFSAFVELSQKKSLYVVLIVRQDNLFFRRLRVPPSSKVVPDSQFDDSSKSMMSDQVCTTRLLCHHRKLVDSLLNASTSTDVVIPLFRHQGFQINFSAMCADIAVITVK